MSLIDRQAAIDELTIEYMERGMLGEKWAVERCIDAIKNLPSAQEWIPCSEGLPEKDDIYLVNVKDGWFPKNVLPIDLLRFEGGKWTYFEFETDSFEEFEDPVVAWMPLPVPYKGGDA